MTHAEIVAMRQVEELLSKAAFFRGLGSTETDVQVLSQALATALARDDDEVDDHEIECQECEDAQLAQEEAEDEAEELRGEVEDLKEEIEQLRISLEEAKAP